MNGPSDEFWVLAGFALFVFALLAGFALIAASGGVK